MSESLEIIESKGNYYFKRDGVYLPMAIQANRPKEQALSEALAYLSKIEG